MSKNRDTQGEQTQKAPNRRPRDQETPQERAAREDQERRAHREWMEQNEL
jgi:hypothetical protein